MFTLPEHTAHLQKSSFPDKRLLFLDPNPEVSSEISPEIQQQIQQAVEQARSRDENNDTREEGGGPMGWMRRQFENWFGELPHQTIEGAAYLGYGLAQPFLEIVRYTAKNVRQTFKNLKIIGTTSWGWTKYFGREAKNASIGSIQRITGAVREKFGQLFSKEGLTWLNFAPKKLWHSAVAVASPFLGTWRAGRDYITGDEKAETEEGKKNVVARGWENLMGSENERRGIEGIWKGARDSLNQVFARGPAKVVGQTADAVANVFTGGGKGVGAGAGTILGTFPFVDVGPRDLNPARSQEPFDIPPGMRALAA